MICSLLSAPAIAEMTKNRSDLLINLIDEKDVTYVTLSLEFERASIDYETREEGKSLYIIEPGWFPFWCRINKNSSLIALATYIPYRDSSTELQRLTLANDFNRYAFGVTAYVEGDKLKIDHILNYKNGLLRENFIRVSRNFSAVITKAIRDHDPNYELLMPLSEMSSESDNESKSE